ncbi:MAG: right-handed parallel beta-helix repeat-containing protein [Phycisphaerales bacterium]|nr:MAG: right-handed parallel beta-helix repeat-containing protein [Phycisphaerales bacterium]
MVALPFIFLLACSLESFAVGSDETTYTVATYECVGIYHKTDVNGRCQVRYREKGSDLWKSGLDAAYDSRDGQYRSSLVNLTPNTDYEIELILAGSRERIEARTRSDHFPTGLITRIEAGTRREPLRIERSGTPEAYHLVVAEDHATIDVMNAAEHNILVDADYVIIRGLELKNAARHGILIEGGRHDIVIEDCRITFWGRVGGPVTYGNTGNMDSAIYAKRGAGRLTVQRNLIENPRGGSNDWDDGHPAGPQAISLNNSAGANVIRYNEIRSTEDHGYNDAFGGSSNFSYEGSPNRDSDIYGNIISNVWDDAIESEGANMNVRIWGNYTHHTFQHIAVACTSKGPLYIFRNVFGLSRSTHKDPLGGSMIKVGQRDEFGGGRRYVFHNTALQPKGSFHVFSGHVNPNTVTRNNIFDCRGRLTSSREADPPSDFDYDLFTGMDRGLAKERHGLRGKPSFIPSTNLEFFPALTTTKIQWGKVKIQGGGRTVTITDPVVTVPNPVIDAGNIIPGFNDDFIGDAPDLGAFERGGPPIRFGRIADRNFKPAPWE